MIPVFWLALWLQMSAQPKILGCQTAEACFQRAADETDGKPPATCKPIHSADGSILYPDSSCQNAVKSAEPVDVPAVQLHEEADYLANGIWPYTPKCPAGFHYGAYHSDKDWPSCEKYTYTCADKSRVLLTSEDGKKHCIKFLSNGRRQP